ncbi:MAG: glycoside hydrolase family 88 protein [Anaerolineales bacterium]|nr:glycoside hydrolase family 88 protein [Anaerolineales bacterium]
MPSSSVIPIQSALEIALQRIKANYQTYDLDFPTRGYPAYETAPNDHWVAGFWPGLLWLSYHATQDTALRTQAEALLPSFAERLEKQIDLSHDLGFLYTLSARAAWMLTGDQTARDLGIRAAQALSKRYNPRGNFIQAWGEIGTGPDAGRVIVDCMMNLPLLYWAAEEASERRYYDLARQHAATTLQYLVRADGSTYHTYRFDPHTGQPLAGETRQGFADESLWTRGQAWAIYGFALTAQWTGEAEFLDAARDVAACFLRESPVDKAPLWDLRLPEGAPQYLDSSAGAIAACGLLRLAHLTGEAAYHAQAEILVTTLIAGCMEKNDDRTGLLKYGAQHVTEGLADDYLIYGDYYFLEALLTLTGHAPDFWGSSYE